VAESTIEQALAHAAAGLRALDLGDAFEPRAAQVLVEAGLHRLCVPASAGGLGGTALDAVEVLSTIGAIDGATGLGFAMQVHTTGALRDAPTGSVSEPMIGRIWSAVVGEGALLNNAATEEGGGSPARGAIPGTQARPPGGDAGADGPWRLSGEKTWTTWLPNLSHAFVTARIGEAEPAEVGIFLVELMAPGVERRPGFEALGMRGSASGRLVLTDAPGDLVLRRSVSAPDPRGAAPQAWFGLAIAAVYLGIGEGVRDAVAAWALDRRPGDGSSAVADIPSVQLRLGRMDVALRAARIVVLDVARRWDDKREAGDVGLAKLIATQAAVDATDEALRIAGGPGFLVGRLERAFRDARAGLINPPLEDVALGGFARSVLERVRPPG
jgi:alkylation response protein AidB-like acyl-CoA dehydrogenase